MSKGSRLRSAGRAWHGNEWLYPLGTLRAALECLRAAAHAAGLRFYAAENRLRALGDDRCCCGIDGLPGWRPNRANLNSLVWGRPLRYSPRMRRAGTASVFRAIAQNCVSGPALRRLSFAQAMDLVLQVDQFRATMGLTPAAPCPP